MPEYDVAHIREQGVDLIIVPLKDRFGRLSAAEQHTAINELQRRAAAAGLAGKVIPIWPAGVGRMAFIAPRPYRPFFRSIDLRFVLRNVNRRLTWS